MQVYYLIINIGPVMMVQYDKKEIKKRLDNRPKPTSNEYNLMYDPNRILDKVNNFKKPTTPNFDRMLSRPNDGDPLPTYMKVITV